MVLGWAVFIGGAAATRPPVAEPGQKIGMLPRFSIDWKDEGVRRILLSDGAGAMLGVSVSQISLLINTIFASFLGAGSVSWLYYADRLMEFPAGMLGVALGTILLPSLSKYHAAGNHEEYGKLLDWGLRLTLLLAAPAAAGTGTSLSVPLIATLFHHGAFTAADVFKTRDALVAYSVGLLGLILVKVLAPGFYARQNMRTPVKIALVSLFATQAMNLAFVFGISSMPAWRWPSAWPPASMPACSIAACAVHGIYTPQPGWPSFLRQTALAMLVMGGALWVGMPAASSNWLQLWQRNACIALLALSSSAQQHISLHCGASVSACVISSGAQPE